MLCGHHRAQRGHKVSQGSGGGVPRGGACRHKAWLQDGLSRATSGSNVNVKVFRVHGHGFIGFGMRGRPHGGAATANPQGLGKRRPRGGPSWNAGAGNVDRVALVFGDPRRATPVGVVGRRRRPASLDGAPTWALQSATNMAEAAAVSTDSRAAGSVCSSAAAALDAVAVAACP
jgi:hypothetical protein